MDFLKQAVPLRRMRVLSVKIGVCLRPRTGNAGAVSTTPAGGARGLPWRRARLLFADKAILGRLAIPRAGWARARCGHQGGQGRPGCLAHTDLHSTHRLPPSSPSPSCPRNPMTLKSRTWAPCALPPQIWGDIPVETDAALLVSDEVFGHSAPPSAPPTPPAPLWDVAGQHRPGPSVVAMHHNLRG